MMSHGSLTLRPDPWFRLTPGDVLIATARGLALTAAVGLALTAAVGLALTAAGDLATTMPELTADVSRRSRGGRPLHPSDPTRRWQHGACRSTLGVR